MTVFKYFFKILNQYKASIILYTVILVVFGVFTFQNNSSINTFEAVKPDVLIFTEDQGPLIDHFIAYVENHANIKTIPEDSAADALFYRDVQYIITIPDGFESQFIQGINPQIKVQSTGDYNASYMEMLLKQYWNLASFYLISDKSEDEIIDHLTQVLTSEIDVEMPETVDYATLGRTTQYYNFFSYSILAGCVFVIATVMASFRNPMIQKRTKISSIHFGFYQRSLFWGNSIFAFCLWLIYSIISMIILPEVMFSIHGVFYLLNSFIFTLCALSLGFFIGSVLASKEAINGIVNVVALGSAFLCGAFVPMDYLPSSVLTFAHLLPSYWFIANNEWLKTTKTLALNNSFGFSLFVLLLFALFFFILTNIFARKKAS